MNFIDALQRLDLWIFKKVNLNLAHSWNDLLMKLWSAEAPWFTLAAFFLGRSAYRRQWSEFKTLLWMGATVGLTDFLAAQIFKPWVDKVRPCRVEDMVRIVDGCAGAMSFPSNHSANGAAFAAFWLLWKGWRFGWVAPACVAMVGFSRIYLGRHYPTDVLAGFCFGGLIGIGSYLIFERFQKKIAP